MNRRSIKLLLGLVVANNVVLKQKDVKTSFLHGELEEEGFVTSGHGDKACLLKRSVYGFKQSPRQWCKLYSIVPVHMKSAYFIGG